MQRDVKKLEVNSDYLLTHRAVPFTLNKKTSKDKSKDIYSWNTVLRFYPDDMQEREITLRYLMDNLESVGLDDVAMPDQPTGDKLVEDCHEITFEEFCSYFDSDLAKKEGTIWNISKNYTSIFMTKDTFDKIKEKYGRSVSLVYPAADCAVVRYYDSKKEVVGLTHSNGYYTGLNEVGNMTKYMISHFGSSLEDIEVFVGAHAREDWEYTGIPKIATNRDDEGNIISYIGNWDEYIEPLGDNRYLLHYGDMLYDQLVESGISEGNIYFSPDNTLFNKDYYSHARSVNEGEKEGRNLFGITFDPEDVIEDKNNIGTILR